jgi:ATP-dependent Clp protease ATP-binding subunit ClpC
VSEAGFISVPTTDPLAGLTYRARKMLQLANQEAHRLNHGQLAPDHLLLGLVKDDYGLASHILRGTGCYLPPARAAVERAIPAATGVAPGWLAWTSDLGRVVERAAAAAAELGYRRAGTGHLLLALLAESPETAARVFGPAGPGVDDIRAQTVGALATTNWAAVEEHMAYASSGPCPALVRLP